MHKAYIMTRHIYTRFSRYRRMLKLISNLCSVSGTGSTTFTPPSALVRHNLAGDSLGFSLLSICNSPSYIYIFRIVCIFTHRRVLCMITPDEGECSHARAYRCVHAPIDTRYGIGDVQSVYSTANQGHPLTRAPGLKPRLAT